MPKRFALAVLTTAAITACGTGTPPAAPVETVTVQATSTASSGPPKPSETAAEQKTLPDVVGMNLQEGQDTLQAAGFHALNDKDATGQNRLQVLDRNWVVTRQSPPAGSKVSTDTLITLYAKKIGE
ncbi:PASTA domain-containing protein [Nonomuraea monospora]|uniref:PASTA domain-containing protein n=1 Tax=Nonomuraea monospora TaxID=568818 RepID=A0ABN3D2T9_9ACTN